MFWEFRKGIFGKFLIKLLSFLLIMYLLLLLILGDTFVNHMIVEATSSSNKFVDIKVGENLTQYKYKRVRCTLKYVINHVVNIYEQDDPNKEIYAYGYVALDDNMENPFCVFVHPSNRSQMENLLEKTLKLKQGEAKVDFDETITIEGYVRESDENVYKEYTTALRESYGENYRLDDLFVYYIYDGVDFREDNEQSGESGFALLLLTGLIMWITVAYIFVRFLQVLFWKRNIHEFMKQNGISKAQLENEFKDAQRVTTNYWITPQYTFYIRNLEVIVIKNKDIVWCYPINWIGKSFVSSIELGTIQEKKYRSDVKLTKGTDEVLQYYELNFPHIVIGKRC